MSQTVTVEPWFTGRERESLRDFWSVYQDCYEDIRTETFRAVEAIPELQPLIRSLTPEQIELSDRESRAQLERAMDGDWASYETNLRVQGIVYAKQGIRYSVWNDLVSSFSVLLVPELVRKYGSEPARLSGAINAMQRFLSRALSQLGESYVEAKADDLRESERMLHATQARNRELEAQAIKNALSESEERFRLVVDGVRDHAILMLDEAGNVASWNDGAERIKGYSRDEIMGQHYSVFFPIEDRETGKPKRELEIALREGRFEDEAWRVRKDGSRFWANVVVTALRDPAGRLRGYAKVTRDFSERRRVEQALRESEVQSRETSIALEKQNRRVTEANRMKSEFLANMSHELRTPLNAIIGFAELIYDGQVTPDMPQYREFVGDILSSGKHLLQLINDVLDLSKVEAGKLEFHPESIDLNKVVGEVVSILRTTAANRDVRIDVDLDSSLGDLSLDAARLKQVLYNYLSNALKFSQMGGRVTVRARPAGDRNLILEVEDTGIGISETDIPRLFVEFQQLDAGAAKMHAGTGLGLALTKRIIEAQGGSVGVRSVIGEGSVFYAILPRETLNEVTSPQSESFVATRSNGPTILIVEDNVRDQATLGRCFTEAGYNVELASTGAQAIEKCRERRFAAITLDLLLPDSTGLDVLKSIRANSKNSDAPVIVVTVVTERGVVGGFAVHDILPKPVDRDAVLASLGRVGVLPGNPREVLVVDDDSSSLKLMSVMLSELGYESSCLSDGESALRAAARRPPLAVVLDLLMPGMNGFQFLERFRSIKDCARVPVIVWTAKELGRLERDQLRSSAQAVLLKGSNHGSVLLEELRAFLPPGVSIAEGGSANGG